MALQSEITSTVWTFDVNNPGKLVQGIDNIKQCVHLILITSQGSDPLRPDFGCGAYDHLDEPINVAVPKMIKKIHEALNKYEPRIENVKVTTSGAMEAVKFTISWGVVNTTINDQLDITYGRGN